MDFFYDDHNIGDSKVPSRHPAIFLTCTTITFLIIEYE